MIEEVYNKLAVQVAELKAENDGFKKANEELEKKMTIAKADYEKFEADLANLAQQRDALIAEIEALKKRAEELKIEVDVSINKKVASEKEYEALKDAKTEIEKRLEELRANEAAMVAEFKKREDLIVANESTLSDYRTELERQRVLLDKRAETLAFNERVK